MKKKYVLIILLMICISNFVIGQILCIYCYDQNAPVSTGINNLVLNGGFENSNCIPFPSVNSYFCPNSGNYSCDITDWTCTGGGSATYACILDAFSYTNVVEGVVAPYFGNAVCNACSTILYDTSCFNNIGCTLTGIPAGYPVNDTSFGGTAGVSLSQIVNGLVPGNKYVLEFWAGGEAGYAGNGAFAVNIGFGDTLLRNKSTWPVSTGNADTIGTRYIIEFNATSSSHSIKFTNWGHVRDSCTELVLDDVRLYTLAELSALVPNCTLGINAPVSQNMISVFHNPVTNELNVKVSNNELSKIILYDITSRKILQQKFINSTTINTEQLAKGLYLYEVRDRNGLYKKGKVVKD